MQKYFFFSPTILKKTIIPASKFDLNVGVWENKGKSFIANPAGTGN